jgi:hypothetical protein
MSIELIVTPILSGIAGFLPLLFIRAKTKSTKLVKHFTMFIIIALAVTTVLFGFHKEQESNQKELRDKKIIANLQETNKKLDKDILSLQETNKKLDKNIISLQNANNRIGKDINDTPRKTVEELLKYGYTRSSASKATSEQISQSQQANTKLDTIQNSSNNERSKTKVVYFPKDIDPNIIQSTLRNIGFNSEIGKAKNSDSTNAIWFGSNVNIEDVKLVAYTLIRAGVKIKTIRPFSESSSNRRTSLIQVGADRNYINKSDLSVEEIRNTTEFRRN